MPKPYQPPEVTQIFLAPCDPIALSVEGGGDGFSGGVPFGLRDTFSE